MAFSCIFQFNTSSSSDLWFWVNVSTLEELFEVRNSKYSGWAEVAVVPRVGGGGRGGGEETTPQNDLIPVVINF